MAFDIVTLASSIAALTISGVTVQDLDETKDAGDPRTCPVLRPYPQAGFEITELSDESMGSTAARKNLRYEVTYALFYAPVGMERGMHVILPGMWAAASRVMTVLRNNDALTGSIDIRPTNVRQAGILLDPSDKEFHGVLFRLAVLEFTD